MYLILSNSSWWLELSWYQVTSWQRCEAHREARDCLGQGEVVTSFINPSVKPDGAGICALDSAGGHVPKRRQVKHITHNSERRKSKHFPEVTVLDFTRQTMNH